MRIVTIGVYGFSDIQFFNAVLNADVDIFVDTRRRRAVRGPKYSFANSVRLQQRLTEFGIAYTHRLDVAPSIETRQSQDQADKAARIRRHDRNMLSESFKTRDIAECLAHLNASEFAASLGDQIQSVLVLCVEGDPNACHRSLLADRLAEDLDATVEHLMP